MVWFLILVFELILIFYSGRQLQQKVFTRFGIWVFAFLYMPATYIHEMSHFLVAQLLGVPSELGSFIPKRNGEQIILGSVTLGKTSYIKRFIVGIAPFVVGAFLSLLLVYAYQKNYFLDWYVLLFVALLFQTVNSMYLSHQDLKNIKWLVYYSLLLVIIILYLAQTNYVAISYFQTASKFLALPIIFNTLLTVIIGKR